MVQHLCHVQKTLFFHRSFCPMGLTIFFHNGSFTSSSIMSRSLECSSCIYYKCLIWGWTLHSHFFFLLHVDQLWFFVTTSVYCKKKLLQFGKVVHAFTPELWRQRQVDLYKFKDISVYIADSSLKPAWSIQGDLV